MRLNCASDVSLTNRRYLFSEISTSEFSEFGQTKLHEQVPHNILQLLLLFLESVSRYSYHGN
jgi:hypothetical protein